MIRVPGFQVHHLILQSQNSEIWRATRESDGRPVILKIPRKEYAPGPEAPRLRHEFEILKSLDGVPGCARPLELLETEPCPVLVLEDSGGQSLRGLMDAHPFSLEQVLGIGSKLAQALSAIHGAHIIHKDISPGAILYDPERGELSIVDFGQASGRAGEEPEQSSPDFMEGSLAYVSPELTGRMNRTVDYRTDLYSLGATLYEMLTRRTPFSAQDPLEMIHCHIAKAPRVPSEIDAKIPGAVSDIVMKLLAKTAERRYKSCRGLQWDLEECIRQWNQMGQVYSFPLGAKDVSDQLIISQKLYGREAEIELLLRGFERVCAGRREAMLVTGSPGVGKTALVREVQEPMTGLKGAFLRGKFDAVKTQAPYTAVTAAISQLVRQVLTEHESRITKWREKLLAALGPNAPFLLPLMPELQFLLGSQPEPGSFTPMETQHRIGMAFRKFVSTFARCEHPLILFLDDMQWADAASLKLLHALMTDPEIECLYLVGTYRDEMVPATHPLQLLLGELGADGVATQIIPLPPLTSEHIVKLLADTLQCAPDRLPELAQLVQTKTNGNPFFIGEFLQSLFAEGLLRYDPATISWTWDLGLINQRGITDNVVDLMATKIQKQNKATERLLTLAACLGTHFDLETLAIIAELPLEEALLHLAPAVEIGLVLPLDEEYKTFSTESGGNATLRLATFRFAHDRIQQAAYSLLPEDERPSVHWRLGQLLRKHSGDEQLEQKLFDIANHLNLYRDRLKAREERADLARLNLRAGRKAKAQAAFEQACGYFSAGAALLREDGWERDRALMLALKEETAETAYLCGDFQLMYRETEEIFGHAGTILEKAKAYEIRIEAQIAEHRLRDAVHTGLEVLKLLGAPLPRNPTRLHSFLGLMQNRLALLGKNIDSLAELPEMKDPLRCAQIRIMRGIATAVYLSYPKLMPVMLFAQVNLVLKHGHTEQSASIFGSFGIVLCGVLGDFETGAKIGSVVERLIKKSPRNKHCCRAIFLLNTFIRHWKDPIRTTFEPYQTAYQLGLEAGDYEYAAMCATLIGNHSYHAGRDLETTEREMAGNSEAIRRLKQNVPLTYNEIWRQATLNLMGHARREPWLLSGEALDRDEAIPRLERAQDATGLYSVYYQELILANLFGQYPQAMERAQKARDYEDSVRGFFGSTRALCHQTIAMLRTYPLASRREKKRILGLAALASAKFKKWAAHAPMNHEHLHNLLEAERLSVLGAVAEASLHYDQAVRLAHQHQYINDEAFAEELAGLFYLEHGNVLAGRAFLDNARGAYERWGARAKVRDIEERFGAMLPKKKPITQTANTTQSQTHNTSRTATNILQLLDIKSVLKATQSISSEIELSRVLQRLMEIVVESAGAERGYLILKKGNGLAVEARVALNEGATRVDSVPVEESEEISQGIVRYVFRTKDIVVLGDAANEGNFVKDPHVMKRRPRSILCTPVVQQGEMAGILYLENNQTADAFTPERVELLSMLAAQAAISIDNAKLYTQLKESTELLTQALGEARESARVKSEFLARTSHELRTPLNSIINIPEGLLEHYDRKPVLCCSACTRAFEYDPSDDPKALTCPSCGKNEGWVRKTITDFQGSHEEVCEHLEIISRAGKHLLSVVNDILDISKLEAGKTILNVDQQNLGEVVSEVALALTPLAKQRQIKIRLSDRFRDVVISADRVKIRQIFYNLVGNALKFSPSGGEVELEVTENDELVQWHVADHGIGIAPSNHQLIFESFHQVEGLATRRYGGTGLGLAITRHLVELHGGVIWVESDEGKGAKFIVRMPRSGPYPT